MRSIIKFFISSLFICLLISGLFLFSAKSHNLKVYFCDVGQGDGIYIRFPTGADFLIDGGRGSKVLDCLGYHMPFYDRKIEVMLLTHPQSDHLDGLLEVLKRYKVDLFITSPAGNTTDGFRKLTDLIHEKKISVSNLYTGGTISFGQGSYTAIWPEKKWVQAHLSCTDNSCLALESGDNRVLGIQSQSRDLNSFSQMGILTFGDFDLLLTGDGDSRIQSEVLGVIKGEKPQIEVMKVPHHGSKTGLSEEFLQYFKPQLAVISVGKNSYGHPSHEIIDKLSAIGVEVRRTDFDGTIGIKSDGKSWQFTNP